MNSSIILLILSTVICFGYGSSILFYVIAYYKAKKNWNLVYTKVVSTVAYPRSFGIVPIVEYEFGGDHIQTEVYHAQFSDYKEKEDITILINPQKPLECMAVNKIQFLKNILLLIFIFALYFSVVIVTILWWK